MYIININSTTCNYTFDNILAVSDFSQRDCA